MPVRIFGFGLLRNGIKYDYPFRESLLSLKGLVESVTLALGSSEDGTEASVRDLGFVEIVPTVWDESLRQGGKILSQQTNLALQALREKVKREGIQNAWGVYLQSDEVINESEHAQIRADIERANAEAFDAVRFRYLHYWQSYFSIAVAKRWYPQEIRAIRLDSPLESYGDAQSFKGATRVLESDAFIHHFGHVREPERYQKKLREFHRWWHSDSEMPEVIKRGEKNDAHEPTVRYLGPYPRCMEGRMHAHLGDDLKLLTAKPARVLILGEASQFSDLLPQVEAGEARFGSLRDAKAFAPDVIVPLAPKFLDGLRKRSRVPGKMGSPQAREWSQEFVMRLIFAEAGVKLRPRN